VIESRRMRWAEHVARVVEMRNVFSILVGKSKDKRLLGRPRRRWEDNIKMYLRRIGWEGVNWIHVAQNRDHWRAVVKTVMNLWFP
jgi:hypothetical protein